MNEGTVVICSTGQAGTVVQNIKNDLWILLCNGDIWCGPYSMVRLPQDEADLAACPFEVARTAPKLERCTD